MAEFEIGNITEMSALAETGELASINTSSLVESMAEIATEHAPIKFNGIEINPTVAAEIPKALPIAFEGAMESVAIHPEGIVGKAIQVEFSSAVETEAGAKSFHDKAFSRALSSSGGEMTKVTPELIQESYKTEAHTQVTEIKDAFKNNMEKSTQSILEDVAGKDEFKVDQNYKNGGSVFEQAIENPVETEKALIEDGKEIDKANPEWREKLKVIAEWGPKALLALGIIGAIIPGGGKFMEKLARLGGNAVAKVTTVIGSVVKSFFGPIIKLVTDFIKKFAKPLAVIAAIILIILIFRIYNMIRG